MEKLEINKAEFTFDPEKTRDEIKRYAINYCAESKTVQDIADDFTDSRSD